jgi:hypothetical protein
MTRPRGQPPTRGQKQTERMTLRLTEAEKAEIVAAVPEDEKVGPWVVEAAVMRARPISDGTTIRDAIKDACEDVLELDLDEITARQIELIADRAALKILNGEGAAAKVSQGGRR